MATKSIDFPRQISTSGPNETVGLATVVIFPVLVALQPFEFVQVAVYTTSPKAIGVIVSVVPKAPVFQVTFPTHPVAVKVAEPPKQTVLESTEIVGFGLTTNETVAVAVQLAEEVTNKV